MNNILVFNVNWVGDVIFSSPAFRAIKRKYPNAKVCCIAAPRVKEILEMTPGLDEIIIYDEKGKHSNPFSKLALIFQLRKKRFDIAFLLHRSLTRVLLVFLAGIPIRIGYDTKRRGFLLTHKLEPLEEDVHRSDYYMKVFESYGINVDDKKCELIVNDEDSFYIERLLSENGISPDDFLVVLNCGGNWNLKRWPKENFSLLNDCILRKDNIRIVLTGAQKDTDLASIITKKSKFKPLTLTGKTNLKQLAALMKRANIVISADSGPLHIANCVGAKTIALFGPTRPEITGPKGRGECFLLQRDVGCNRTACYHLKCNENICMKSITVDDVVEKFEKIRD